MKETKIVLIWYSVEDSLPILSRCLVSYRFGVGEARYYGDGKFYTLSDVTQEFPDVTHWAYLPKKVSA